MAYSAPSTRTTGDIITAAIWNQDVVANMIAMTPHGFSAVINEGGGVLTAGVKCDIEVPAKCTLTAVRLLPDQSGSIVVDFWKCTFAEFDGGSTHPVDGDSITGATTPTISSDTSYEDTSLSDWTVDLDQGDIIRLNVDSCSSITRCTVSGMVSYA